MKQNGQEEKGGKMENQTAKGRRSRKLNQNCEEGQEHTCVLIPRFSCCHGKYGLIKSKFIWENFQ